MLPAHRVSALVSVLAWMAASAVAAPRQNSAPNPATATIRGTVLDVANGTPVADVSVQLQDAGQKVKTDGSGRFELAGVQPGRQTVYVSIVGFILVKRAVQVAPGETVELTIALTEGTGTYSETVNVTTERFPEQEKAVPAQQTLGSADIQNLRNLLTNDPMRAIQVLPGVTTGDDFRSEFAVRGNNFNRVNFTFDGIPSTFLLHTVQQEQDGGSVAMVNGDILGGITLLNGSYPQRYGNRLGAELDFQMRAGSRDRAQMRIGVSGTDFSLVTEGPLGRNKAGSWLVSARKSYLELLLKQISDDNDFGFGFTDVQSKLVYDLSSRHRLELSLIAGRSRLDQTVDQADVNDDEGRQERGGAGQPGLAFHGFPVVRPDAARRSRRESVQEHERRRDGAGQRRRARRHLARRRDGRPIPGAHVRRRSTSVVAGPPGGATHLRKPARAGWTAAVLRRRRGVGVGVRTGAMVALGSRDRDARSDGSIIGLSRKTRRARHGCRRKCG